MKTARTAVEVAALVGQIAWPGLAASVPTLTNSMSATQLGEQHAHAEFIVIEPADETLAGCGPHALL